MPTTTARILASLDVIRYELMRMDTAVADAKQIARADRSALKREVAGLAERTDALIEWLSEQRLETGKN
jgi:hypothetical protein